MAKLSNKPADATSVEQTSKSLKLHQLASMSLAILGGVFAFTVTDPVTGAPSTGGVLAMTAGVIWYAQTCARVWWHHS